MEKGISTGRYMTAKEAATRLGVSAATLYAYVSRGLIRSEGSGQGTRTRRYHAEDVLRLLERKEQRRTPSEVAGQALFLGEPVLESAITLIADGRFYYRGRDALRLAASRTIEEAAALLWTGEEAESARLFADHPLVLPSGQSQLSKMVRQYQPVEAYGIWLTAAAAEDPAAYDLRPAAVAQTGARILRLLTTITAGRPIRQGGIAESLQRGWVPADPSAIALLNMTLILCADHELNVTSFAARCVASAGATPYGVVLAGLAALQGAEHGGQTRRIEAFFNDVQAMGVRPAIAAWLARGESIPGFGHALYPEGDPRGRALLESTMRSYPQAQATVTAAAIVEEGRRLLGAEPGLHLGLVALSRAMGLPDGAALAIFALGRTIGWIGHAIEQYQTRRVIRPRARYIGPTPAPSGSTVAGT